MKDKYLQYSDINHIRLEIKDEMFDAIKKVLNDYDFDLSMIDRICLEIDKEFEQ